MLYDILPPLLFFVSLAGIIVVVSRVVARLKRTELSQAIQTEGSGVVRSDQQLFNPGESRVTLVKSRLAALSNSLRQSLTHLKSLPGWLRLQMKRFKRKTKPAVSRPAPFSKVNPPKVTLRQVESTPPPTIPLTRLETTTQRLQALVKKSRVTTSPVQAAEQALSESKFSQAEDILVPYLAKHPKNTAAYLLLSEIAAGKGKWDETIEILEQVVQLDAATPQAYAKLGEAALAAGHMTRALEALQRAHDADQKDITVLKNLLKIAQRRDDRVLQKSVIHKMILLAPDDPEVHLAAEALEAREHEREQTPATER